jgi:hypothetical protein
MRAGQTGIALVALAVVACATAVGPAVRVADVRTLAGTYTGTLKEVGKLNRPSRLVIQGDGRFELTTGGSEGFRTTGLIVIESDGRLGYEYDGNKGTGTVHEGDGRRVIVLTRADGSTTITVDRSLP